MTDRSFADGRSRVELARVAPFRLGAAEVRPPTREVVWPDRTVSLEPRVMQVLVALHRAGGAVLTRDDLIASCWDGVVVGDDAISRTIGRLRRLSEVDGGASFRLETLPRVGLRLAAASAAMPDAAAARPRRRPWALALCAALLLAAGLVWIVLRPGPTAPPPGLPPLIAILPFDSTGPQDQVLADGIALSLGDGLSRSGLRVIGATSSFRFRGADKPGAGRRLGAQYVVDGALQRSGRELELTLRMEDVARGITVWSGRFRSDQAERLQDRAGAALQATIAWPAATRAMRTAEPLDPQAVALFLASSGADRRGDYLEAIGAARRLMALAPDAPLAQANLGIVTADALSALPPPERWAARAEALRAIDRAMRRDPAMGEVYVARALLAPRVRWSERAALFEKAIAVDPDNGAGHIYYASFLQDAGQIRESLQVVERARALDPFSTSVTDRKALALAFMGQDAAVDLILADGLRVWPDSRSLAATRLRVEVLRGRRAAAQAMLDEPDTARMLAQRGAAAPLHILVRAMPPTGSDDLQAAARACLAPDLSGYPRRLCLPVLSMAGDVDTALRVAERLYPDQRARTVEAETQAWLGNPERIGNLYMLYAPALRRLRADPRSAAIFERLGLAAYWRATGRWPDFCAAERVACARLGQPG
jgi:TolB-like protein/DNA-binding winged helix-turn-helix (wHTH) protein